MVAPAAAAAAAAPALARPALLAVVERLLAEIAHLSAGVAPRKNVFEARTRGLAGAFKLIDQYNVVAPEALLAGIVYLGRCKGLLTATNVPAAYLTCTMLAHKYLCDIPYDNKTFAQLLDVPLCVINRMELAALEALDFSLTVSANDIELTSEHVHAFATASEALAGDATGAAQTTVVG